MKHENTTNKVCTMHLEMKVGYDLDQMKSCFKIFTTYTWMEPAENHEGVESDYESNILSFFKILHGKSLRSETLPGHS